MAARDRRQPRAGAPTGQLPRQQPRRPRREGEGVLPVLADAVRDIEVAVQRGRVRPSTRTGFQAVALLVREERSRVQSAASSESQRTEQLKRIEGVATALARTAARDGSLLALLTDDAELLPGTAAALRELRSAAGLEPTAAEEVLTDPVAPASPTSRTAERQVVPRSVISR